MFACLFWLMFLLKTFSTFKNNELYFIKNSFRLTELEKEMATHSSVLAWRIPGMWEPGGLQSMVSHRVRHD